jgi:DNA polymerase-3 subunit delta
LLYILWGEDEFSREEALQNIKKSLGDMSMLSTNTSIFDAQKLNINELRAAAESMPFLAPQRLVIIKGLLQRFEPSDRSSKTKKSASKSDESQSFADCLNNLPPTTVLILDDNIEFKKPFMQNNPLYTAIVEKATVKSFPTLRGTKLSQWIQDRVNQGGCSISRQANNLMVEFIGGDLFTMSNEIQKLTAFCNGRQIDEKDVRSLVSASQEADIFVMVDAILDRKAAPSAQILQKLLQNGVAPAQILVLLARQIGLLVQIKELKSLKRPSSEIQTRLGVFSSFVYDKLIARAEKYSMERLKDIYQNLLETDLSIKTGKFEADLAVNILVAELCS